MYRKIHPLYLGIGIGITEGLFLFTATIMLLLQGDKGAVYLGRFFPFYSVSVEGAFIGLAEGFMQGFVIGVLIGGIYNLLIRIKLKPWK